jgi:hypothetical protein
LSSVLAACQHQLSTAPRSLQLPRKTGRQQRPIYAQFSLRDPYRPIPPSFYVSSTTLESGHAAPLHILVRRDVALTYTTGGGQDKTKRNSAKRNSTLQPLKRLPKPNQSSPTPNFPSLQPYLACSQVCRVHDSPTSAPSPAPVRQDSRTESTTPID